MVLDHSQVVIVSKNSDSRINVSQLGTPKHTPHMYPGTDKTNPLHFYKGVHVPVQTWTLSLQHLRPRLSAVLRPPPIIYP
jgi:hypothetical protein